MEDLGISIKERIEREETEEVLELFSNKTNRLANDLNEREERKRRSILKKRRQINQDLLYKYGITLEDYEYMYEAQEGKCAVCSKYVEFDIFKRRRLVVDHSHESGHVRGLLCSGCNTRLGSIEPRSDILKRSLDYLEATN